MISNVLTQELDAPGVKAAGLALAPRWAGASIKGISHHYHAIGSADSPSGHCSGLECGRRRIINIQHSGTDPTRCEKPVQFPDLRPQPLVQRRRIRDAPFGDGAA